MRVFLTGATGFLGSAVLADLLNAGHQVLGLARSNEAARSLITAGAEAHRGDLKDLDSLRSGAAMSDGVLHTAFDHDFSKFAENSVADRRAIDALGDALAGSDRPLIVTAGLPFVSSRVATEEDVANSGSGTPRVSEQTAIAMADRGVRVSVVRMPQAHDRNKHGLASYMITLAREKGISAYVGEGLNRWAAVHRLNTAPVYRLALEKGASGAGYHAVTEEGVPLREIAEAIGRGLKIPVVSLLPEEAKNHFGWLAFPVSTGTPASAAITRQRLGWRPTDKPGFLEDLENSTAFATAL